MKSFALALCAAVLVAGQQAPQDQPLAVNCRANSDCRTFDATAQCLDGMCDCTSTEDRTDFCTGSRGQDAQTVVALRLSFVYNDINCNQLNAAIRTQIRSEVNRRVAYTVTDYDVACGSVIVTYLVNAPVNTVDTVVQSVTASMQQVQQAVPLLVNSSVTTETVLGNNTQQCVVANAASTAFLEGKTCFPTCNTGFTRVLRNSTYSCVSSSSGDDDLSPTTIAVIVVACVLFCGILVAVAYLMTTGKPNSDVATNEVQNEPYNEEKQENANGDAEEQNITV